VVANAEAFTDTCDRPKWDIVQPEIRALGAAERAEHRQGVLVAYVVSSWSRVESHIDTLMK